MRQLDLTERDALAELCHGDIDLTVEWMARNGRISTGADRAEAIGSTADDLAQATGDLSTGWANERRQEWVIDQHQTLPSSSPGSVGIEIDLW